MKAYLISEKLEFKRGGDPLKTMNIGIKNNPNLLLKKFIQDFNKEFEIKLIAEPCGRLFNIKDEDIIAFRGNTGTIIEEILHNNWGQGLFIVLTKESALKLFGESGKPGWFARHQPPSSQKDKLYYFDNVYFMPEILKRLQRLQKINIDNKIQKRKIEIFQLEKLKNVL